MFAVFTIAQSETYFLRKWAHHYREQMGPDADLYVLNHLSALAEYDAFLEELQHVYKLKILDVGHTDSYQAFWLARVITRFQQFLKTSYEIVIHSSVDQYLVSPDMKLCDYLHGWWRQAGEMVAIPQGYEIVQAPNEKPLELDRPWLAQRQWYTPSQDLCRPAVAGRELFYGHKARTASNVPASQRPEPGLFLLHAHRIDHALCLQRHRQISCRPWLSEDRQRGPYRYNLIEDHDQLWRWFSSDPDDSGQLAKMEKIPDFLTRAF